MSAKKRKIDINSWNRKDHFEFFGGFTEPFYGMTADVECTGAFRYCKKSKISFFLYYLHKTLEVVNKIPALKLRIENDGVVEYEVVHSGPAIKRPDGPFAFSHIAYFEDFEQFSKEAEKEIDRVQKTTGIETNLSGNDVIHFSTIPWVRFTSISHARHFGSHDSIPKITFGKMYESGQKRLIPVSIHVNHALVDGEDVGRFYSMLEEALN